MRCGVARVITTIDEVCFLRSTGIQPRNICKYSASQRKKKKSSKARQQCEGKKCRQWKVTARPIHLLMISLMLQTPG